MPGYLCPPKPMKFRGCHKNSSQNWGPYWVNLEKVWLERSFLKRFPPTWPLRLLPSSMPFFNYREKFSQSVFRRPLLRCTWERMMIIGNLPQPHTLIYVVKLGPCPFGRHRVSGTSTVNREQNEVTSQGLWLTGMGPHGPFGGIKH